MRNLVRIIGLSLVCMVAFCLSALAQDEPKTRSITSDDFAKKRPKAVSRRNRNNSSSRRKRARVRSRYRFKSRRKGSYRKRRARKKRRVARVQVRRKSRIVEIGMTVWRMRAPIPSDNGYKLPIQLGDGSQILWTSERVPMATKFRPGDRVRLGIESSVSGYLYIVDSEILAGGLYGEPYLIFPQSGEDNYVKSGLLVDIPDQNEELPYFLINPKRKGYQGELLTVIISPKPLQGFSVKPDGQIRVFDKLLALEESTDMELFSRTDMRDKIYSNAEAQSACGSKTRQLTRIKSSRNPCGVKTRQLTRQEPMPQSIVRVRTNSGAPAVAFLRLNVEK